MKTLIQAMAAYVAIAFVTCAHGFGLDDPDLLLYFSANDDGNHVVDDSGNGNDGDILGTVDFADGKYGSALDFTGAGTVQAPFVAMNDRSFTVCMWVNPRLEGGGEQCVFSQTQAKAQNTSMHFRVYLSGQVRMGFYSNDLDAPAAVQADEWAHIAFWTDVDEGLRRLYVNGEQVAEDAGKAGLPYLGSAGETYIGSWQGQGDQPFNGLIDEVQIWDRALTEADIQASMDELATLSVDPKGKLATTFADVKRR